MPRYFFNIRDDRGIDLDREGLELSGVDAVRSETMCGAKDLICERITLGRRLGKETVFEVADETGEIVHRLSFADILSDT